MTIPASTTSTVTYLSATPARNSQYTLRSHQDHMLRIIDAKIRRAGSYEVAVRLARWHGRVIEAILLGETER